MKLSNLMPGLKTNESQKSFVKRHPGLILYLLITLLVVALYLEQSSVFEGLENRIQDAMFSFRGEQQTGDDIVVLEIDDSSVDYLGYWPWSHSQLAQLTEALDYYQPRTMFFNFHLKHNVEDYVSGNSQLLAENILQSNNIILPYSVVSAKRTPKTRTAPNWFKHSSMKMKGIIAGNQVEHVSRVDLPEEIFGNAARYLGADLINFESDNSVRYQPLIIKYENNYYPTSELMAAAHYMNIEPSQIIYNPGEKITLGRIDIPIKKSALMLINYLGKDVRFASYTIKELWEGAVPIEALENKLVMVNLTATGFIDELKTPISETFPPGEKSATVIQNIINSNFINSFQASANLEVFIILGIGLFCAFLIPRVSLVHRFTVLIVFLFVLININFILFSSFNTITKTFYPALEILLFIFAAPMISTAGKKKQVATSDSKKTNKISATTDIEPLYNHEEKAPSKPAVTHKPPSEPVSKAEYKQQVSGPAQDEESMDTIEFSALEHSAVNIDEPLMSEETIPQETQEPTQHTNEPETGKEKIEMSFDNSGRPTGFGRYKIIDVLGQGAMGTVYRGLDPAIGRPVALKTIRFDKLVNSAEAKESRERFMLEAKAAGNFSHPHIVTIYDVGQEKDIQYIAMEYLEGHTLDEVIKRKLNMSFKIVANIITQVCNALQYAHDRHVVHRDIKPANIMVMDGFNIKVMDFGIAHIDSSNITQTGIAMGTPNYISPEQLSGKEVTKSSDIFSVGVVMYEMLTGLKPFAGENISNLIMKILNHNPDPPSKIDPKVPPLMDHVVMKALEKDPVKRYHSAAELASSMEDFQASFSPKSVKY
jgi:eukaryotic-like serine/threonine-protein kinase